MRTHIEANPEILRTKGLKPTALFTLRAYSFYDQKSNQRKVSKKSMSGRKMSELAKDLNRDNSIGSIKKLIEKNIIKEEDGYYIIEDVRGQYFDIDTDFLKELLRKRTSDYIVIYLWLRNRFLYRCKEGRPAYFSIKDIVEKVYNYHTRNQKVYDKIKDILAEIVADGLITYYVIEINENRYLRQIMAYNDKFVVQEAAKKQDKKYFTTTSSETNTDTIDGSNITTKIVDAVGVVMIQGHCSGEDKAFSSDEIYEALDGQEDWFVRCFRDENIYHTEENRRLLESTGLFEKFPQLVWTDDDLPF